MMTRRERAACLARMRAASADFYRASVQSGCHAFIEFTGLLNQYIRLCEEAHGRGEDFTDANVHAGRGLPLVGHQLAYLNEKLTCIYGLEAVPKPAPTPRVPTPSAATSRAQRPRTGKVSPRAGGPSGGAGRRP
jgi:hypothetical protein